MKRETIETYILAFCIITLAILSMRVITNAEDLSCDQCTITFNDKLVAESMMSEKFIVTVEELFYPYIYNDTCVVGWDPVQGFISTTSNLGEKFDV